MNKAEKAKMFFSQGYNCSQSILLAFCEDLGLDYEAAAKVALSFGGGMGQMRETCGALTGAFMVLGLANSTAGAPSTVEKDVHYQAVRALAETFRNENGSLSCRELIAKAQSGEQKKKRCSELVSETATILEKFLSEKNA